MTREEPTLPGFAANCADHDHYAVEREPRPHHNGERIRLHTIDGAPAMLTVLRIIRAANLDGWRLDKHSDKLVVVPEQMGNSR